MILTAHIVGGIFAAIGLAVSALLIWHWKAFLRGFNAKFESMENGKKNDD